MTQIDSIQIDKWPNITQSLCVSFQHRLSWKEQKVNKLTDYSPLKFCSLLLRLICLSLKSSPSSVPGNVLCKSLDDPQQYCQICFSSALLMVPWLSLIFPLWYHVIYVILLYNFLFLFLFQTSAKSLFSLPCPFLISISVEFFYISMYV